MFLEQAKQIIVEYTNMSTIRRTKKSKRSAFQGRTAINMARTKNVGMYNKYKRQREQYLKTKKMMQRQFKSAATRTARQTFR